MSARLAALALVLSLAAGAAVAALPQVNLRVELRSVPAPVAPAAAEGFAVGTRSGPPATPGELRLRTGPGADSEIGAVLVRNGSSASLHLARWRALATGDWAWGGADAGVGQTRQWIDAGRGLRVHPRWPGGRALVTLEVGAETAHHLALQTTLDLVPGIWVDVARSADAVLQVRVLQER